MIKLDHLAIFVDDVQRSRDWYGSVLDLEVEFEVPDSNTIALQDDFGFTLFIGQRPEGNITPSCALTFQVEDIETRYEELSAKGVPFKESPKKLSWGYGAELLDPDGYVVCLWDEVSMREKGGD